MKLIQALAKDGLKFKKKRKEGLSMQKTGKPAEAAKERWWQKWNIGKKMGSNAKGVSKKKY